MSLRDLIILSVALIIWGIVMGTGLLLLIAPDRAPRLWWIGHALLTEEDLRTPWRRINARLTGALVVVMCAYMLWGFFLGGGSQESSVSRSVEAGEVKRMVFPTTLFGWLIWFFSWFVVPLVMFWVFVIDGLRMLIRPAKWVSNTRRGKKYWPRMQRAGVTIRQLRVLGFVFALGGTMILVSFVPQLLRTFRG